MLSLTDPDIIQNLFEKHNFAPNKFLGQNFLVDEKVLGKIIEAADLQEGDNVIEIGPGFGVLTQTLLAKGANVAAIEKDKDLIPALEENLKEFKNYKIINGDFLALDSEMIKAVFAKNLQNVIASESPAGDERGNPADGAINTRLLRRSAPRNENENKTSYKVVSNIPYYITSPVLRKILTAEQRPEEIVFLVQREVAERISAEPGQMSVISVFVQFYGMPSVVEIVKPKSFWPAPKVESAILKIVLGKKLALEGEKLKDFWRLVKIGFSSRRKTLANNLAAGFHAKPAEIRELLLAMGFSDKIRAQELRAEDWLKLSKNL